MFFIFNIGCYYKNNDPSVKDRLDKIQNLIFKNYQSIKKLVIQTETYSSSKRVDLATLTEISRRSRQVNQNCMNELSYILNREGLNDYSTTIRMIFQIFSMVEDLFVSNYLSCINYFTKQQEIKTDSFLTSNCNSGLGSTTRYKKRNSIDNFKNLHNNTDRLNKNFQHNGQQSVYHNQSHSLLPNANSYKNTDVNDYMVLQNAKKEMDVYMSDNKESMAAKQSCVNDKVDQLLHIWNRTHCVNMFKKETDPLVILEIQKRLHSELESDFKVNIDQMESFLERKQHTQDNVSNTQELTQQLTVLDSRLRNSFQEVHWSNIDTPILHNEKTFPEDHVKNIWNMLENEVFKNFSNHQKKVIYALIIKILKNLNQNKIDKETSTADIDLDPSSMMIGSRRNIAKSEIDMNKKLLYLEQTNKQLKDEISYWKNCAEKAYENQGMTQEQVDEMMGNLQTNSPVKIKKRVKEEKTRSNNKLSLESVTSDNKQELQLMLSNIKDAYQLQSGHHDSVISKIQNYQQDFDEKVQENCKLCESNKYQQDALKKAKDFTNENLGKKLIVIDKSGKEILNPDVYLGKNNLQYMKLSNDSRSEIKFSKYIKDDLKDLNKKIEKHIKKHAQTPNIDNESPIKKLNNDIIDDLLKKSTVNEVFDLAAQGVSKLMIELYNSNTQIKPEDIIMERDENNNIIVRDKKTGQIIPKDLLKRKNIEIKGDRIIMNTKNGKASEVFLNGKVKHTEKIEEQEEKKYTQKNKSPKKKITQKDGTVIYEYSSEEEEILVDPSNPKLGVKKIKRKKKKQVVNKDGTTYIIEESSDEGNNREETQVAEVYDRKTGRYTKVTVKKPNAKANTNSLRTGPNKIDVQKSVRNILAKKKLEETAFYDKASEGGKCVGVRSEQYAIDRGGVEIIVYDIGTNTEITAMDMSMGVTNVKPEILMGSAYNEDKENERLVLQENMLEMLPNLKPTLEFNKITGESFSVFELSSGHKLKIAIQEGPKLELEKSGLRSLVHLLCKELGIDDLFSTANQVQLMQMKKVIKGGFAEGDNIFSTKEIIGNYNIIGKTANNSLDSPNKDSNRIQGIDLFSESEEEEAIIDFDGNLIRLDSPKKKRTGPVTAEEVRAKRTEIIENFDPQRKVFVDRFMKLLKKSQLENVAPKIEELLEFQDKGVQASSNSKMPQKVNNIDMKVIKQIKNAPKQLQDDLAHTAMEQGKSTGGAVQLDITKLTKSKRNILTEKPPEIRKKDDLIKDEHGNLIDKNTGKVVVDSKLTQNQIKDEKGNQIDKDTGKVIFDSKGQLQTDVKAHDDVVKKKEEVKQLLIKESIKDSLQKGTSVVGYALDEKGEQKQVSANGRLVDYVKPKLENSAGFTMDKLVDNTKKAIDNATSEDRPNVFGSQEGGSRSRGFITKTGSHSQGLTANRRSGMDALRKRQDMPNYNTGRSMDSLHNLFPEPAQKKITDLKKRVQFVLNNPNASEADKKQAKDELQTYFQEQLSTMPNLYQNLPEEELQQMAPEDLKHIADFYNPLNSDNKNSPDFYKNIFKVYKMSRAADGSNLHALKYITPDGQFLPDFDNDEFENFAQQIREFAEKHHKCGTSCKHLLRFYAKLGFYPYGKYLNKHPMKMPKLNMATYEKIILPIIKKKQIDRKSPYLKAENQNTSNYEILKSNYRQKRPIRKKVNLSTNDQNNS